MQMERKIFDLTETEARLVLASCGHPDTDAMDPEMITKELFRRYDALAEKKNGHLFVNVLNIAKSAQPKAKTIEAIPTPAVTPVPVIEVDGLLKALIEKGVENGVIKYEAKKWMWTSNNTKIVGVSVGKDPVDHFATWLAKDNSGVKHDLEKGIEKVLETVA